MTQQLNKIFDDLFQYQNTKFDNLSSYDEIYFLGDFTYSFSSRVQSIASLLPNFSGVILFSISPEKRIRLSNQIRVKNNYSLIEIGDLASKSANKKILILDFNDDIAGKNIAKNLISKNIQVMDYIYAMSELNLLHTYLPVKNERDSICASLEKYRKLLLTLTDDMSRQTLIARLKTYLTLDRTHLLRVNFPFSIFNNDANSKTSLIIRENEIYVDAGAAHGDTVCQFFHLSRGSYKAMYAFEPDVVNFNSLQKLCNYLPNIKCFNSGLSDTNSEVVFFQSPENRFGSNFITASTSNETDNKLIKIMKLDDIVESASLIKIDVEGFESKVIKGATRIIKEDRPNLSISAYHYPNDLFEINEAVENVHLYKNVALRHFGSTLYDTIFMYSDSQSFD